jgi:uncharacterized protein (TIGR02246 family)
MNLPDHDELRDFAMRYTAAWCSGDPSRVATFYSPDGSLTINGGTPSRGREEISAAAEAFMVAFPDLVVAMDDLRMKNGGIEYHWTLAGTNTGPGGTGHRIRISGHECWKIDADGLILDSQGSFDREDYKRQLAGDEAEPR